MKIEGDILTSEGWIRGQVEFDDKIIAVNGKPITMPKPPYILPGFVDLHVHGGAGADMMTGIDAMKTAAEFHASHGTTSLLVTSVTAPLADIDAFLEATAKIVKSRDKSHARVLGAHLEGPFINPDKLGAQPPFAIPAQMSLIQKWLKIAPIKVMTLAPEMDHEAVMNALQEAGVKVQIGHTLCTYAQAVNALQNGAGVTHLFNAMSGLSHRDNGTAGAALAYADYAEIIPDLHHVEEGAILAARRAIPRLYGVTDAMAGAGMPDGEFQLGTHIAIKHGDEVRLPSGSLAGSVLTMDQALRNFVKIGLPLEEASKRLSTIPANWIGEKTIGRIKNGAHADLIVFNENLQIQQMIIAGEPLAKG